MATIYIDKGTVLVESPIGFINFFPLPSGLPSGLTRMHLTRDIFEFAKRDLVSEEDTGAQEFKPADGEITYSSTGMQRTKLSTGLRDLGAIIPYSTGFTWLAVDTYDLVSANVAAATTLDWSTSPNRGLLFSFRSGGVRFNARVGGIGGVSAIPVVSPIPTLPMMAFASYDPSEPTIAAHIPHADQYDSTTFDPAEWAPNSEAGLGIGMSAAAPEIETATTSNMRLFAQWDRALTQAEMNTTYSILKPWLSQYGVNIA